jgi:hypothetical protein
MSYKRYVCTFVYLQFLVVVNRKEREAVHFSASEIPKFQPAPWALAEVKLYLGMHDGTSELSLAVRFS